MLLKAAVDLFGRGRIRQSDMIRAAERLAGNRDDVRFAKSLPATSAAEFNPPRPKNLLTFGKT